MNAQIFSLVVAALGIFIGGLYGITAISFMFSIKEHELAWFEHIEAELISDDFVDSPYILKAQDNYRDHMATMFVHTIGGGGALILQLIQITAVHFNITSIKKHHRKLGYLITAFLTLNLVGSAIFLIFVSEDPADRSYGGYIATVFYILLIGLWFLTLLSAVLFIKFAREHHRERHMLMALWNHGNLWSAPLLRVGWVWIGASMPSLNKEEANFLSSIWLIPLVPVLPLVYVNTNEEQWDSFKSLTRSFGVLSLLGVVTLPIDGPYQDNVDPFFMTFLVLSTLTSFAVAIHQQGKHATHLRYINQMASTLLFVASIVWFVNDDKHVLTGAVPFQGLCVGMTATLFSTFMLFSRNLNHVFGCLASPVSMWFSFFAYQALQVFNDDEHLNLALTSVLSLSIPLTMLLFWVCYYLPKPLQQLD